MSAKGQSEQYSSIFKGHALGIAALYGTGCFAASELRFERLSLEQGLSQSSVHAMAEDAQGYIWFGTEQGADRFDGYAIHTLRHAPGSPDSIAHSNVRSFHSGLNGWLWLGTQNGLNRVDPASLSVEAFHMPDADWVDQGNFQVSSISNVCGDHLMILSNQGPWFLKARSDHLTSMRKTGSYTDWPLTSLHVTPQGEVWLANHRSLWRFNCYEEQLELVKRLERDGESPLRSGPNVLTSLPDGRVLWAGETVLWSQVDRHDPMQFEPVFSPPSFREMPILAVHVDQLGRLWALLSDRVLRIAGDRLDGWTQALLLAEPIAAQRSPRFESAFSGDGLFWLAGSFGLAVQSGPGQALHPVEHDPLDSQSLPPSLDQVGYRVKADRFGVLWIGANLGGVARYVPGQYRFEHLLNVAIGANNVVRGLVETNQDGNVLAWVGIEYGGVRLYRLAGEEYRLAGALAADSNTDAVLPGNRIAAMARHPESGEAWVLGDDWLARIHGDLAAIEVTEVTTAPEFHGARHLAFSPDGRYLYVTTSESVWRSSQQTGFSSLDHFYSNSPNEESGGCTPILVLSSGELAVGCRRGLNLIDPDSGNGRLIRLFPDQPLSPVNFVFSLHEAANGTLWLGTHTGGLVSVDLDQLALDHPSLHWWTTDDGLADNTVYAILGDAEECLWLTGNRGISHLCPDTGRVRNFSLRDGLQAYEFNGRVADIGPSGRYYFGGINGFNVFRPAEIVDHPEPPLIRLQGVSVNEQPVELKPLQTPRLELSHRDNSLVVDYLGLHSVAPEAIRYAYRLVGIDPSWIEAGTVRRARYPALPPGHYRFDVRAANPDGVWSEPRALLEATVPPPPWRTWPAYVGYLLALISLLAVIAWSVIQRRRQLEALVARRTHELDQRNQMVARQATELESLLESRQTLYANVSHELRTPLTLIRAGLDRLKKNPGDAEALELGERYIHRLDRLIDQLLDLSKVRADAFAPEAVPWPLAQWLRRLARDHQALAEHQQLQLDLVVHGQWHTHCNRELLEKCLTNLLSNAFKYTPAGGQIILRLGGSDEQADIEVADTGPGIPTQDQATIFERFHRVSAEETQAQKGAGIGLGLVHEAVMVLGGEIRLISQPGQGSRFTLAIPARQAGEAADTHPQHDDATAVQPARTEQAPEPGPSPAEKEPTPRADRLGTLLIVEDNRDLRRHLEGLLSDQWNIIAAVDGRQALARLAANDIDIILSDIMMPRMDGLELLQRIRNDLATSHIPFLILTARRDAETRLQGLKLAADAILTKPFSDEELCLRLANTARAIERRRRHNTIKNGDQPELSPRDHAFIDQVNAWLEENYGDSDTRITDLASLLAMDERTLQRKTQALFGQSPRSLLTEYRLDCATALLRQTDGTVATVAAECGFSSASYFGRQFSKRYGQTPSAWKKWNFGRNH